MARLYANENFPLPGVQELRRRGHDVLTTREAGNSDRAVPDDEVLAFAQSQGRALLTLNRKHFIALHRLDAKHAGIIACTFDVDFVDQARRIHEAIETSGELDSQLLRVNRKA